jgi:hypothetical protein
MAGFIGPCSAGGVLIHARVVKAERVVQVMLNVTVALLMGVRREGNPVLPLHVFSHGVAHARCRQEAATCTGHMC